MPQNAASKFAETHPLDGWRGLHQEALGHMETFESALSTSDWASVDEACRWIYEVLRPHNEAEEREFFPRLGELGAKELQAQLLGEHREIWDLNLQVLTGITDGTAADPGVIFGMGQCLLSLVRQHIETEEHRMLPLLTGRSV